MPKKKYAVLLSELEEAYFEQLIIQGITTLPELMRKYYSTVMAHSQA